MKKLIVILISLFGLTAGLFNVYGAEQSVISYSEFHNFYYPHDCKMSIPDIVMKNTNIEQLIYESSYSDSRLLASVIEMTFADTNNMPEALKLGMTILLTNIPRQKAGSAIDNMKEKNQVAILNLMDNDWTLDLIYYVSEATYNRISNKLNALRDYTKIYRKGILSYDEFHASYKPHYKNLPISSDVTANKEVKTAISKINSSSDSEVASMFEILDIKLANVDSNIKGYFWTFLLTHIPREKAGRVLDNLNTPCQSGILNNLDDEWTLDLVYFMSRPSYNKVSNRLKAIRNYQLQMVAKADGRN